MVFHWPGLDRRVTTWLVISALAFAVFTLASAAGLFSPKNPAQRFEEEMSEYFRGASQGFQAQGVLINEREFRVTVLNPDETKFRRKPSADSSVSTDANLNQECYQAWQIMTIALSAIPDGIDPGYTSFLEWKWPVTVEWGWTNPGTLETKLNRHTFTAEQTRQTEKQCLV